MRSTSFLIPLLLATPSFADTCTVPDGDGQAAISSTLIIEDNAGDGDMSVVGKIDAEDWRELCVFDPNGTLMLRLLPDGGLGEMGMGKASYESREPTYDEMDYAALKAAWAEGQYSVRATGRAGGVLTGEALFTTVLPKMPVIVTPETVPDSGDKAPVLPMADLKVEWVPVTESQDGRPLVVTGYAVSVVKENHDDPNGASRPDMEVHLGPDATSWIVPAAFLDPASLYELEIFVIEQSGNQTIGGASFFATE
jgi:hypothetical protein